MNKLKTAIVQSSDEQEITAQEIIDIKTDLALENVNNTSDQNKPISTSQQNALDDKVDKEKIIGQIYNKNQWLDTLDFVTFGDINLSVNQDSFLNCVSTTTSFNNNASILTQTKLQRFSVKARFKTKTTAISGTGFGLGIYSDEQSGSQQFQIYVDRNNSYSFKTFFNYNTNKKTVANIFSSYDLDDVIDIEFTLQVDKLYVKIINVTKNEYFNDIIDYITYVDNYPTAYKFALMNNNTEFELQNLEVKSNSFKKPKLICLGDSNTVGFGADSYTKAFPNLLDSYFNFKTLNFGFPAASLEQTISLLPSIIDLQPENVLIMQGAVNIAIEGQPANVWQPLYAQIVNNLENAGIKVWHLLYPDMVPFSYVDLRQYLIDNYPNDRIINPGRNIPLRADGLHFNQLGHDLFFNEISNCNIFI